MTKLVIAIGSDVEELQEIGPNKSFAYGGLWMKDLVCSGNEILVQVEDDGRDL